MEKQTQLALKNRVFQCCHLGGSQFVFYAPLFLATWPWPPLHKLGVKSLISHSRALQLARREMAALTALMFNVQEKGGHLDCQNVTAIFGNTHPHTQTVNGLFFPLNTGMRWPLHSYQGRHRRFAIP
jgi:hypothetical protein